MHTDQHRCNRLSGQHNGFLDDRVSYMLGNGGERVLILAEGGSVCSNWATGRGRIEVGLRSLRRLPGCNIGVFDAETRRQSHLPRWQTRRTSCGAEFNSQLRMA